MIIEQDKHNNIGHIIVLIIEGDNYYLIDPTPSRGDVIPYTKREFIKRIRQFNGLVLQTLDESQKLRLVLEGVQPVKVVKNEDRNCE